MGSIFKEYKKRLNSEKQIQKRSKTVKKIFYKDFFCA